ncbi:UNVERIFIED_CONTAM: Heterogeneous nuclear ribonucleoprotein 1 [Sesamum latifolium]|uniref:Heterogeneous nuclear ribonucleoprotein 1 n=1 Tax=Sesamum latifolium TaxID=2727402 RepID=A0AAW2TRX8_9LAMI
MVEAKKAVPRDDHQNFNRNNGSIQGSPCLARTKKIFVGGLASTVTESDFKRYFDQFGTITDVVVMYDHNTQRPRGFGFITYDSEEAVDKVLVKTFHELNGKMVEVKRAVPKELSPGPTRSPSSGYNYGLNRASSFLNPYSQGYNANSAGGYGMRMDGRFSPVTVGRSGYAPYSPSNHSIGSSFDSGFSLNLGASADSGLGYGHGMNSYFSGNPSRYGSPIAYGVGSSGNGSLSSATNRNVWANGNSNYGANSVTSNDFVSSGTGNAGTVGGFGTIGEIWGFSPVSAKGREGGSLSSGNILYGRGTTTLVAEQVMSETMEALLAHHYRILSQIMSETGGLGTYMGTIHSTLIMLGIHHLQTSMILSLLIMDVEIQQPMLHLTTQLVILGLIVLLLQGQIEKE